MMKFVVVMYENEEEEFDPHKCLRVFKVKEQVFVDHMFLMRMLSVEIEQMNLCTRITCKELRLYHRVSKIMHVLSKMK